MCPLENQEKLSSSLFFVNGTFGLRRVLWARMHHLMTLTPHSQINLLRSFDFCVMSVGQLLVLSDNFTGAAWSDLPMGSEELKAVF